MVHIPPLAEGPRQQLPDPFNGGKKRWMTLGEHELLMHRWQAEQAGGGGVRLRVPTPQDSAPAATEEPETSEPESVDELRERLSAMRSEMGGIVRASNMKRERELLFSEFQAYQANYYATTEASQKSQFWNRMKMIERRLELLISAEEIEAEHPGEVSFGTHRSQSLRFPIPLGEPAAFTNGVLVTSDPVVKAKVFQAIKSGKHRGLRMIQKEQRPYFHVDSREFVGWWTVEDLRNSGLNYRRYTRW